MIFVGERKVLLFRPISDRVRSARPGGVVPGVVNFGIPCVVRFGGYSRNRKSSAAHCSPDRIDDSNAKEDHGQAGFPLIELVAVFVVLWVLAATAVPRFIDLRGEADEAALEAMGRTILGRANSIHAKSILLSVLDLAEAEADTDLDGVNDVEFAFGYPSASRSNGISKIMGSDFARRWTGSTTCGDPVFWLTTASLGGRSGPYVNTTAVRASNRYILTLQRPVQQRDEFVT